MKSLLQNAAFDYVGAAIAAANNTDDNSSRLDMAGFDSVIFATTILDSVDTGVAALTIQTNSADSDTGMTASGSIATATSAANDDLNDELLVAELINVLERYVQGTRTSATANIAYGECISIRFVGAKSPITQSTSTVAHSISVVDS